MACKATATGWGITIGAGVGTAVGVALGHVGAWLAIGAGIGLLLLNFSGKQRAECAKPDQRQK